MPVISEYRAHRTHAETRELIDQVTGTLGVILFAITAVGVVAAPLLILLFAPGFLDDDGRFRARHGHAAADVPLFAVCLVDRVGRQDPELLSALCDRGIHARVVERRDDRLRGLG